MMTRLPSVTSVAVKPGEPGVEDLTVKVTMPEASESPEAAEIVSVGPRLEASVTALPETAAPPLSFNVTVMVEVLTPSARCEVGEAVTVEVVASAGTVAARKATQMPALFSADDKVAFPVPVLPAAAFVFHAAPTDVALAVALP